EAERVRRLADAAARAGDATALGRIRRASATPAYAAWAIGALRTGSPLAHIDRTLAEGVRAATPPEPPPPPAVQQPVPAPAAPPNADVAGRLKKLDELKAQKLIDDAEYQRERERILKEGL